MAEEEVKIIVKKTNKHSPQHPVLANKSWRVPAYEMKKDAFIETPKMTMY